MYYLTKVNNQNTNYKKLIIGSLILYIPLLTFNIMVYSTLNDINNLLNTDDNMDYIHKIKIIIDGVCKDIINCNID